MSVTSQMVKIFQRILFVSRVFGASGLIVRDSFSFKRSKIYIVLHFAILSFAIYYSSYFGEKPPTEKGVAAKIIKAEYNVFFGISFVCQVFSLLTEGRWSRWLQQLASSRICTDESDLEKLNRFVSFVIAELMFVVGIHTVAAGITKMCDINFFLFYYYIGNATIAVLEFSYSVYLLTLFQRQKNAELKRLRDLDESQFRTVSDIKKMKILQIKNLSEIHIMYSSMAENLNKCFDVQVFLFAALCFIEVANGVFVIVVLLRIKPFVNVMWSVIDALWWTVLYVAQLVVCSTSCQMLKDETEKTKSIIIDLMLYESDEQVAVALASFLNLVEHSEVNMTALGLFRIDNSFIRSMIGGITSTVVVFVQLDESSKSSTVTPEYPKCNLNLTTPQM